MSYAAVIFDLDGTLVDSMNIWEEVPEKLVRQLGYSPEPGLVEELRTRDLRTGAELLIRRYRMPWTVPELLEAADRLLEEEYRTGVRLKPGAGELVRELHWKGVPLCIATASTAAQARGAMERYGLLGCFDFILSCTEYGGKGKPDIFLEAARRFGLPPRSIAVVEDSLYAARTAARSGFFVVGVADGSAAADREELQALCGCFVESLDQLDRGLFRAWQPADHR